MSRSGYSDDCDGWALIQWRGAVQSALRGARGQHFLRQLRDALIALPEKRLITGALRSQEGVCALGAVKSDLTVPSDDYEAVARFFGQSEALVREVMFLNDEQYYGTTPEHRYELMLTWVNDQIVPYDDESVHD